jgi:hypothetical protein
MEVDQRTDLGGGVDPLTHNDDGGLGVTPRPSSVYNHTGISSWDLLQKSFPELKWTIDGVLPEGSCILAGAPKTGKSWLTLQIGVAASLGGRVLGDKRVTKTGVLYLALEDSERRLQRRLNMLQALPSRDLRFVTSWPQGEKGLTKLRDYLVVHDDVGLVIVDTLQRLRGVGTREDSYASDYDFAAKLHSICQELKVSVIANHHTRKAESDDPVHLVSGTQGLTGAVDTVLVLRRARQAATAELFLTSRDIEEQELALRFEDQLGWTILGDAAEFRQSGERQEIIAVLREAGEPMRPADVARLIGKNATTCAHLLTKLAKDGFVDRSGYGKYAAREGVASVASMASSPSGGSGVAANTPRGGVASMASMASPSPGSELATLATVSTLATLATLAMGKEGVEDDDSIY